MTEMDIGRDHHQPNVTLSSDDLSLTGLPDVASPVGTSGDRHRNLAGQTVGLRFDGIPVGLDVHGNRVVCLFPAWAMCACEKGGHDDDDDGG